MATKFNAFTGNFDLTGSGGGGASYIDGEVATFNDLPVTVGTPAVNSAYLVRGAQGVWPVSYKPGGIYVRSGNAGTLADWTYSGVFPDVFSDAQFLIYDDADTSKNAQFSAASISTGTTRTYTLPNANGTLALTNGASNLWIPASAWIPRTTNGCGVDSREITTNNFDELLFDAGADEFAQALVVMPNNWNLGTVTARFYWTASTGSGDVVFGLQGRALADDDALSTAMGTAQTVADTLLATNDMHISSATSAITIAGSPSLTTPLLLQIYRDADAAGDTLAVDARLLGVKILYTAA